MTSPICYCVRALPHCSTYEQKLITKEHICSNACEFNSSALYSSTLVIKVFYAEILTETL